MRLAWLHLRACVVALSIAASVVAPAAAAELPPIDLSGANGDEHVEFLPFADATHTWPDMTIANAGDVNGDGYDDVATQFASGDPDYRDAIYVIFSDPVTRVPLQIGNVPLRGFKIQGERVWRGLTAVGDVNDDGYGDIAYYGFDEDLLVVYGKPDNATVDTSEPGPWGFKVKNVEFGVASGFGSSYMNHALTSVGDQNGDGRRDVAFRDGFDVRVVFTRVQPGSVLDAEALGNGGYTLVTGGESTWNGPYVGDLGDVDGDGRGDFAVGLQHPAWTGDVHAYGVTRAAAGETVDLRRLAADGRGFEWQGHPGVIENMTTVGDQNGDGRREIALITHSEGWRTLWMPFTPATAAGERDFTTLAESEVVTMRPYTGNVIDVGDQNADGFGDLAVSQFVAYAGPGACCEFAGRGYHFWPLGRRHPQVLASLGDMDGDGRREIVVGSVDGVEGPAPGPYAATYAYDVYYSRPRLQAVDGTVTRLLDSGDVRFEGALANPEHPDVKALGSRAHVQIVDPEGREWSHDVGLDPATRGEWQQVRVDVPADEAFGDEGLREGVTYGYRMVYENAWGTLARSSRGSFTYPAPEAGPGDDPGPGDDAGAGDPGGDVIGGGGAPAPTPGGAAPGGTAPGGTVPGGANPPLPHPPIPPATGLSLTGTTAADRLVGGPFADRLRGFDGRDTLRGGAGKDLLDGGAGNDVLDGGRGRDRLEGGSGRDRLQARDGEADKVRCGSGRDVAVVDRADRVSGCERVRRG